MAQQIVGARNAGAIAVLGEHNPNPVVRRQAGCELLRAGADRCRAYLIETLQAEIIPRMVSASRAAQARSGEPACNGRFRVTAQSVAQFTRSVLAKDTSPALAYVEIAMSQGLPLEAIYLDLLAASARHLGLLWDDDLIDFAEVTIALGRLQQIVRELDQRAPCGVGPPADRHRALILPVLGNQHTFGSLMAGEFLRRAGWGVRSLAPRSSGELTNLLREQWFAIVGFSASCDGQLSVLSDQVRQAREASRNRRIGIMVGGPVFAASPQLVAKVGADGTALDGGQVPDAAASLVRRLTG
jgi:MerR family transcriptional regulator, light-induced transcriptional regulator